MTTLPPDGPAASATGGGTRLLVAFLLVGAAVSVALGVYGRVHELTGSALTTLGFPSLIWMKVTLASAAMVLCVVQIVTALRIFGRIGHGHAPRAVAPDAPHLGSYGRAPLGARRIICPSVPGPRPVWQAITPRGTIPTSRVRLCARG